MTTAPFRTRRAAQALLVASPLLLIACQATETNRVVPTTTVTTAPANYNGPKYPLALGRFDNRTPYGKGIFSDGIDHLGDQSRQILKTHLFQSKRFDVLDRENMEAISREADLTGQPLQLEGARYLITGAVTEFGRKETGGQALAGILGGSKQQVAYAKVQVTVFDARTSKTIASAQGAGEFALTTQQILGFGSKAGYDATLTDKVINLAMIDCVNKLVIEVDAGALASAE